MLILTTIGERPSPYTDLVSHLSYKNFSKLNVISIIQPAELFAFLYLSQEYVFPSDFFKCYTITGVCIYG